MERTAHLKRPIATAVAAMGVAATGGTAAMVATAAPASAATVEYCEVRGYDRTLLARFRVTIYSARVSATIKPTWYGTKNYRVKPVTVVWNEVRGQSTFTTKAKRWQGDTWNAQTIRTTGRTIHNAFVNVQLTHRKTGESLMRSCLPVP